MQREFMAFFDVDHTISRHTTTLAFILVCMRRGFIKWWYLLAMPILYVMYRLFSLRMESLFRLSLPKLMGVSRSVMDDIAEEAFSRMIQYQLYPGALAEMERLRAEGVRVILATSAPFEVVYPLAKYCGIGAADVIATQFAYIDGVFDGRLIGMPVFSRFKCNIIRDFVARSGTDLHYCSFYTDSIHDLPLLELIGRPVAANPDLRLRCVARRRGWLIKDFSR